MPIDPMTGQQLPYGDENLDAMAMQEMMGDPAMAAGGEDELVPVMVPAWTAPAVEELVELLLASDESDMSGGMDPMMGGMDPMMGGMDPMAGGMDPMAGGF
jgi:hypothetical protein